MRSAARQHFSAGFLSLREAFAFAAGALYYGLEIFKKR
jgi:hypothetical protein